MGGTASPQLGAAGSAGTSKRIKNTFSRSENECFTPATLCALCRYGFPVEKRPEEAKERVMEDCKEYDKRCTHSDGEIKIASLDGIAGRLRQMCVRDWAGTVAVDIGAGFGWRVAALSGVLIDGPVDAVLENRKPGESRGIT